MGLPNMEPVRVFEIARAGTSASALLVLLVPVVLLLGVLWLSWPRSLKIEVSPSALRLRGSVYGRVIPRSELLVERLQVVDTRDDSPYALARRTNGIGLPQYAVGWFRLKNGEKALAFVTQRQKVVHLPTRQGYSLLLSVEDHEGFAASLSARPN